MHRRSLRGAQGDHFPAADRFFDRDGRFGNAHEVFEPDRRTTALAYGFKSEFISRPRAEEVAVLEWRRSWNAHSGARHQQSL